MKLLPSKMTDMMVGLFLVTVCLTIVRLDAVFWSCAQDCSWKTINNDTKSCTFEEEASGIRAVCANIFESGADVESRRHRTNSEVNLQSITPFISLNKKAEKIIGLNVSFQLPTDAEKNEYRGILIKFTSKQNTHCFYVNFNEPLKIYDILIMKTFGADAMSFHFDCIRGLLPGETYKVAIIMMAYDSTSKEVEKAITIPLTFGMTDSDISEERSTTRTSRSIPVRTWKPRIQQLSFSYPNATLRFSLGPYVYLSYLMILRSVICIDGKNCRINSDGPSVELAVEQNQTIKTHRYRDSSGKVISYVPIPPDEGKAFLEEEYISLSKEQVVFVVVEFYFLPPGDYRFDLLLFSSQCPTYTKVCGDPSPSKPQTNTDDACFYRPCGNATCIDREEIGEYECQCYEAGFVYNKSENSCMHYDVCNGVQCRGGRCQNDTQNKPMCVCLPEYIRDEEGNCVYEPCNVGWCLKKTVSIVATIATVMIMTTSILLYRKLKGRLCNDGKVPNHLEESDEIGGLASLEALKEFSKSIERHACTCSLQCDSPGTSNSSGGYILVSPSEPSGSLSTHCHCNPSCRNATPV